MPEKPKLAPAPVKQPLEQSNTPPLSTVAELEANLAQQGNRRSVTFPLPISARGNFSAVALATGIDETLTTDRNRYSSVIASIWKWRDSQPDGTTLAVVLRRLELPRRALNDQLDGLWTRLAECRVSQDVDDLALDLRESDVGLRCPATSGTNKAMGAEQDRRSKQKDASSVAPWYEELVFQPREGPASEVAELVSKGIIVALQERLSHLDPTDFSSHFSEIAAVLKGVQTPIVEVLQEYLDRVQQQQASEGARGFGSGEKNTQFALELKELMYRLDHRLACPSCGAPSILRVLTNKIQTGSFEHSHNRTSHSSSVQLPALQLRPANTEAEPRQRNP